MQLKDKVTVVTGGGGGIGRALCMRFAAEGARAVVVADVDGGGADETAVLMNQANPGCSVKSRMTDVAKEAEVRALVREVLEQFGHIDLFCSNAGIFIGGDEGTATEDWQRIWEVNVMAHVYAARAVLPSMLQRGEGYLLNTASAAGLLNQVGSAPYGVTKHAAVGFAEWLSITYGGRGIKVSVLCPQAVRTAMVAGAASTRGENKNNDGGVAGLDGMLEPEEVAEAVVQTLGEESFLCLPHPEVLEYMRRKSDDYDRWLGGMRRLQDKYG